MWWVFFCRAKRPTGCSWALPSDSDNVGLAFSLSRSKRREQLVVSRFGNKDRTGGTTNAVFAFGDWRSKRKGQLWFSRFGNKNRTSSENAGLAFSLSRSKRRSQLNFSRFGNKVSISHQNLPNIQPAWTKQHNRKQTYESPTQIKLFLPHSQQQKGTPPQHLNET